MADFPGMILTAAGRQLQAKAQIGQALTFTRVALGSGATPAQPEALTAMVDEEKSLSIQSFEVLGDGTSKMRVILTNQGVTEGFFVTEIGVFARDPDTLQEHLYSYSNSGAQSDFLPAEGGATVVEQIFDLITVVGTAQNVTALIDDFITIATKADVDELRPYTIPAAGTVGQMLRKATNAEGDAEWFDPSEGYDLRIASVSEVRTAVEGQSVFNLSQTITSGLAVYVDGLRLRTDEWDALNATQVRLDTALTAGQKVEFVNNEEVGAGAGGGSMVTLDGPSLVFPGSSNTLTITNHDSFSTYAVATDVGTASLSGATITLDIPGGAAAGNLNLSVTRNGATAIFQIAIGAQSVAKTAIILPPTGATGVSLAPLLTSSAFTTYPNGADTHASSDWEISDGNSVVWSLTADAANLVGAQVPANTLLPDTAYTVRVRHNGANIGSSEWSDPVPFTTTDVILSKPVITSPADGAVAVPRPTAVSATAFATDVGSDSFASAQWQVSFDQNFSSIHYQITAGTNETVFVFSKNTLPALTEVFVRVRHYGDSGLVSPWSDAVSFTTEAEQGQVEYTIPGSYTFVVPAGVTSISVVAIGAGQGGAAGTPTSGGRGGNGGGLAYQNNIAVTPGQEFSVEVADGGRAALVGESQTVASAQDTVFSGFGQIIRGAPGNNPGVGGVGTEDANFDGGAGGDAGTHYGGGGGGAAGYAGNGGFGGVGGGDSSDGLDGGSGNGGGGGGAPGQGSRNSPNNQAGGGGGVGLKGQGSNGAASGIVSQTGYPGSGGFSGNRIQGGNYGGGGGGGSRNEAGVPGGNGAVRIMWPGDTRLYPSTNTADV